MEGGGSNGVVPDAMEGEGEGGSCTLFAEDAFPLDLPISLGARPHKLDVPIGPQAQHHLPINSIVPDSMTYLLCLQPGDDRYSIPFAAQEVVAFRRTRAR